MPPFDSRGVVPRRRRWRDQRADRCLGPHRHPIPASPRPVAPLRGGLGEHGRGRCGGGCRRIDPRVGRYGRPKRQIVAAMLTGGVIAAPVAAWSVRHLSARPMGLAVAALLLLTNARELGKWAELGWSTWFAYGAIVVLVCLAALRPRRDPGPRGGRRVLRPRDHDLRANEHRRLKTRTSHGSSPSGRSSASFCASTSISA